MSTRSIQPDQKFGALETKKYSTVKQAWECQCICGKKVYRNSSHLKTTTHPSCGCQRLIKHKLPNNLSLKRKVLLSYKEAANRRSIEFLLTEEQFLSYIFEACYWCGMSPSNRTTTTVRPGRRVYKLVYNGIDRIDNSKGYTMDNCVTCCKICNKSKSDLTVEEWKSWLSRAYHYKFNDYPKGVGPSGPETGDSSVVEDEDIV
jgi:hypothetical protein